MKLLDHAVSLARRGFYVFPAIPNSRFPAISGWQKKATRDEQQIEKWWSNRDYNIGISTSRFGDDKALVVVDVDNKNGKNGSLAMMELDLMGFEFPTTVEHSTPSGGRHLIYVSDKPVKQGVSVLGDGLDIRSSGGLVIGPGSTIDGRPYAQINGHGRMVAVPSWIRERCGADPIRIDADRAALPGIDPERAAARGTQYLENFAPWANQGEGGDTATFKVAAQLKDFGCSADQAYELMLDHWNEHCDPPWEADELARKVDNAFAYGREPQGAKAPEAVFDSVEPPADEPEKAHPVDALSEEYAFIKAGALVVHETTDEKGRYKLNHLSVQDLHHVFANKCVTIGKTSKPVSKWWMESPGRREYDDIVFAPGRDLGPRWLNLWRGFSCQPAATADHPAVEAFKEHALRNVCGGDKQLFKWLMGYFAHMIQKPWEKPLVALVFKGGKGVGKNALVERVGALLGSHFLVADDERYLLGNFNSHLESNLFLVLDEASWAGDKKAEGRLKGIITGSRHNIERKGQEAYNIDNLTRVCIIGNEDWLVPASHDERRFAVFNVGDGRKQDRKFFESMRVGMEKGGYANLLRYLLDFDLTGVDVNDAPITEGLMDQKLSSMGPQEQWWFECLNTGQVAGGDWGGDWPDVVNTTRLKDAFSRWCKNHSVRAWSGNDHAFGRKLAKIAPDLVKRKVQPKTAGDTTYGYVNPGLQKLRAGWDRYIGGATKWPD